MNRIEKLFKEQKNNILNIYFTAGYPSLNDTEQIILNLEKAGANLLEIGMPYSDPLADGETIQESGTTALKNGMTLPLLFEQIKSARQKTEVPLILMGYLNQVMQYGEDKFIKKCVEVGVDGLILPDLPLWEFESYFQEKLEKAGLSISFLMSPQTSEERILKIDICSSGFIYMVADSSITGSSKGITDNQIAYFERVHNMNLKNPRLIGFGISDKTAFDTACRFGNGAIIGSAFIRALKKSTNLEQTIVEFVGGIRGTEVAA